MIIDPCVPLSTLRDLAQILRFILDRVCTGAGAVLGHLAEHVTPPPDVVVRSDSGAGYTGVLVVRQNEVIAGAVFVDGYPNRRGDIYHHGRPAPLFDPRHPTDVGDRDRGRGGFGGLGGDPLDDGEDWR